MTCTLKKLANELGLSIGTISLALRGSPLVAEKTRKRVEALAAKRDYVQSSFGRALQSRQSRLLGLLLPSVTSSFFNEVLQGAGEAATAAGYGLLLGWANGVDKYTRPQVNLMLEREVDALIIASHGVSFDAEIPRFLRRNKPIIYCTGEAHTDFEYVVNDDVLGGRIAAEALISRGHRAIAVSTQHHLRYDGNRGAAAEHPDVRLHEYQLAAEVPELLRRHPEITGLIAYSDEEAVNILFQLRSAGRRVPEDISVIGFNDGPLAALPEFRLTTVAQQRAALGTKAVEVAVNRLRHPEAPPIRLMLKPELVLRDTLQAPPERKLP